MYYDKIIDQRGWSDLPTDNRDDSWSSLDLQGKKL